MIPYEGTDAATVLVLTKVGSRYEYAEINGASHFIEHLMFKGTKKRPKTIDISRALDAVGALYNAYTGKDRTGYYVKIDGKHVEMAIDVLHDMLFHSKFDPVELNRERGVIIEEINMYRDNPMMHVEDILEEVMFDGSTLGWEIAGSHKTMREMPRSKIIKFRDEYYTPSRMVVVVAGKIDRRTLGWVKKTFGTVKPAKEPSKDFKVFGEFKETKKPKVKLQYKDTAQIQVAMGFPSYGMEDKRNPALELLAIILGGTMSSRLFISVRERRGLAYFVRATNDPYEDVGKFMIQSGLDKTRLPLALKTIRKEVRDIKKNGVTARELREAKDHLSGKLLLRLENSSERAEWYGRQEIFLSKVKTPKSYMKELDEVTRSQVKKVANEVMDEKKLSIAVIGPYKTGGDFLRKAQW